VSNTIGELQTFEQKVAEILETMVREKKSQAWSFYQLYKLGMSIYAISEISGETYAKVWWAVTHARRV